MKIQVIRRTQKKNGKVGVQTLVIKTITNHLIFIMFRPCRQELNDKALIKHDVGGGECKFVTTAGGGKGEINRVIT